LQDWRILLSDAVAKLVEYIENHHGIENKQTLGDQTAVQFQLTKDRSVYACRAFAVRFSSSSSTSFSNTVLSLSCLQKYDDRPFIVCLVTPKQNHCFLANTTFLKKISHSSQELRENNIRGSFNGSDILREFLDLKNSPDNFNELFAIHAELGFEGNLPRLVEATNNISPTGSKFQVSTDASIRILDAPRRAINFISSEHFPSLAADLNSRVEKFKNEILLASLIDNVNVRGRVIEYLIAGEDQVLRQELVSALQSSSNLLPSFKTENALGDYHFDFGTFDTETDVKTKILILNSNPKAYNIDKLLEFLSRPRSVFLFFFVGLNPGHEIKTILVSLFQDDLLRSTIQLRHWSGRNSRGVTQFEGKTINQLLETQGSNISEAEAKRFLQDLIAL
jgi:hypothetical protein